MELGAPDTRACHIATRRPIRIVANRFEKPSTSRQRPIDQNPDELTETALLYPHQVRAISYSMLFLSSGRDRCDNASKRVIGDVGSSYYTG
jgi:hypothetical protein